MLSRFKSAFINLTLCAASTLVALFICEAIVRTWFAAPLARSHQQLFIEHDKLLGWRKIPGVSRVLRAPEFVVRESFNSRGIRGPEYSYAKASDTYRIVILGDSFAEGYTVSYRDLFSEILRRGLEHPTKKVEVINMGTGGYSTDQEVLLFSNEGRQYTPDLTILLFYHNDVWYNGRTRYWRGHKPRFILEDSGELKLTGVPVPVPRVERINHNERALHWLFEHAFLFRLVAKVAVEWLDRDTHSGKTDAQDRPATKTVPDVFRIFRTPASPNYEELWRLTEALLLRIRDDAAAIGSDFIIFYVPFRASIYKDDWTRMQTRFGMSAEHWSPNQPAVELQKICARNHLRCLDPTNHYRREAERLRERAERLYFEIDGHWTPQGNRLAGELLIDFISSQGPLP